VVIGLERGADLHTAQLMPLPLTVSCFSKIQIGFAFLGSPGKRAVKRVCVCVAASILEYMFITVTRCEEIAKKLLEHFLHTMCIFWRLHRCLANSRTYQHQTHSTGLSRSWKFHKLKSRAFQEAWVPFRSQWQATGVCTYVHRDGRTTHKEQPQVHQYAAQQNTSCYISEFPYW